MERQVLTRTRNNSSSVARIPTKSRSSPANRPLLQLQRSIGNVAVQRLIRSPYVQTKLSVSSPGDASELEADRVADTVMRKPSPNGDSPPVLNRAKISSIQRKCTECEGEHVLQRTCAECSESSPEDEDKQLQKQGPDAGRHEAVSAGVYSQVDGLKQGGEPLPQSVRTFFEPRFGHNFSAVRVHKGADGAKAAQDVNARAFTVGHDIAFGTDQYAPESDDGRRLLAHESVHTIQQGAALPGPTPLPVRSSAGQNIKVTGRDDQLQRQIEPNPKCPKGASASGGAAKDAAKFSVSEAQGSPCACLLVVHNNEENARKTAQLMHQHCSYNLALVESGGANRCIQLPGHGASNFDPNEFFGPEIPKECLNDEKSCKDFLAGKADTTDPKEIEKFVQIQFFLSLKDCSKGFSLPVIALHNNDIDDTKAYQAARAGKDVKDLKMDITKEKKEDDPKKLKPLKDLLKEKFGDAVQKGVTDLAGKTNIFRWCVSEELSRCHIGDPKRPDNVIWTTNKDDFEKLRQKDVNVVLQDDPSRVGKESQTDLSTLFLSLRTIMGPKLDAEITKLTQEIAPWTALRSQAVSEKTTLEKAEAARDPKEKEKERPGTVAALRIIVLSGLIDFYTEEIKKRSPALDVAQKEKAKFSELHFINIETPIAKIADQTDAGRKENYEFIVEALKAVNLHCCGGKEAEAEAKVKEGLTLKPKRSKR